LAAEQLDVWIAGRMGFSLSKQQRMLRWGLWLSSDRVLGRACPAVQQLGL
jgi:hypothetical protein